MFSPARGRLGSGRGKGGTVAGLYSPSAASPSPSPALAPARTPQQTSVGALRGGLFSPPQWSSTGPGHGPARTSPGAKGGDKAGIDGAQPVFVCDFPPQVRTSQVERPLQRTDIDIHGGMVGKSGVSWIVHGDNLFVWSHLNSHGPQGCAVLTIPPRSSQDGSGPQGHGDWLISLFERDSDNANDSGYIKGWHSAGVVICNKKNLALIYWPHAVTDGNTSFSLGPESGSSFVDDVTSLVVSNGSGSSSGSTRLACVAIAGCSNGDLWRFDCSPEGIIRRKINRDPVSRQGLGQNASGSSRACPVVWRSAPREGVRQLMVLTASCIECWNASLEPDGMVSLAWSYDILGDKGTLKDLPGQQKQVWLLDLQVDGGKDFTLLLASLVKDQKSSSNFIQYSLLSLDDTAPPLGRLTRRGRVQVILSKARVEEEQLLYSMRLRVGGKPAGSMVILSTDGTATFTHLSSEGLRLYQFDLGRGAGKVLDASVIPPVQGGDSGSWVVLTEKAGVWAIPEKAILTGGLEALERSPWHQGDGTEKSAEEETPSSIRKPPEMGLDIGDGALVDNGEKAMVTSVIGRSLYDEEGKSTVGRYFQQFVTSGRTDSALESLDRAGAFEKEGEMNILARTSRAIVDTLAKHWVAGGPGGTGIMAAVSSQLLDKQRRHQQYLNFLSVSKCHEELQQRQRGALHVIMEHGEKLASMMQLRILHNSWAQARAPHAGVDDPGSNEVGGALWDTVQLVGEKARRSNVLLMDREKSEVFYTRVSELEEFFICVQQHAHSIVGRVHPLKVQIDRLSEIAEASTNIIRAAIQYRDTQMSWYPPPEGLTPWYCRSAVRSGIWKVAAMILDIKGEASVSMPSMEPSLVSLLEETADILLEGYAGAITAKVEREEEYRGLQTEYWSRRDTLFAALRQHAKAAAESSIQQFPGDEQQRVMTLQKSYSSLMALARRHAGYETLFDICTDVNDMILLCNLMRESMGLREGRFSHYVFQQLYQRKQYSKLLRFGEEFEEELGSFLQEHLHLRWLHELFRQQYLSACGTLQSVALSSDSPVDGTAILIESSSDVSLQKSKLEERRRLLYLAKLAALAGGDVGSGEKVAQINASISIVEVQEDAAAKGACGDEILTPGQLVEVCLRAEDRDLVLRSFDVFAFAGGSFREGNKSLLEAAWLRAADQDNWAEVGQISEEEGWSDEQNWLFLQSTVLFQVSKRCYSEEASYYGAPFEDILPLLESDVGPLDGRGRPTRLQTGTKSVEGVLMQHPDFSDAREAMLTALRMGVVSSNEFDDKDIEEMVD